MPYIQLYDKDIKITVQYLVLNLEDKKLLTLNMPHVTIVSLSHLVEKVPLQRLFSAQSLA